MHHDLHLFDQAYLDDNCKEIGTKFLEIAVAIDNQLVDGLDKDFALSSLLNARTMYLKGKKN